MPAYDNLIRKILLVIAVQELQENHNLSITDYEVLSKMNAWQLEYVLNELTFFHEVQI
jgi:hypothetical protein